MEYSITTAARVSMFGVLCATIIEIVVFIQITRSLSETPLRYLGTTSIMHNNNVCMVPKCSCCEERVKNIINAGYVSLW